MADRASIKADLNHAFRDFVIEGSPASGVHEPAKVQIRNALGEVVDLAADARALASVAGTTLVVSTVAELGSLPGPFEFGSRAEVRNDPGGDVPGANGVYSYQGGVWVWISDLIPAAIGAAIQEVGDKADGAVNALGGQSFADLPSMGFYEGHPVLSVKANAQGQVTELITLSGVFVPDASGSLSPVGERGERGYLPGSSDGVSVPSDPSACYIMLILGQSNAEGVMPADEGAVIATTPIPGYEPYSLMPSTGVRLDTRDGAVSKPPPSNPAFISLAPLVEAADASIECYETSASSAANHLIAFVEGNTGRRIRVASMVVALGGASIAQLQPGSTTYAWVIRGLTDMCSAIRSEGLRPVLLPVCWRQGETDQSSFTDPSVYASRLLRLRASLEADASAITRQASPLRLIVDAPQLWNSETENDLALAQTMAFIRDPNIILGPPYYQQPRTVGQPVHMSAVGQNQAGVNLARAIYDDFFAGGYTAFQPHSWWFEPGRTSVTMRFPRPPVFDETGVDVSPAGLPNYKGLSFDDRSGASPVIVDHSISGSFLTVHLSGPSSGPRPRVGNATVPNSGGVPGPTTGARSLLRSDRGPVASIYGGALIYEWSRPFVIDL